MCCIHADPLRPTDVLRSALPSLDETFLVGTAGPGFGSGWNGVPDGVKDPMLIRHLIAACVAGLLCLAPLAVAFAVPTAQTVDSSTQAPPHGTPSQMDDEDLDRLLELHHTEQEEVRLVLLPSTVTDARGRVVEGLEASDFVVFEDYVPQVIRYFNTETTQPISIAFLLDVSGSMRQVGKLEEAKQAIRVFVDALQPQDQFALICFADDQVAWITEFTSDRERFLKRLSVQEAYGQTALFDAVAATPGLVDAEIGGRKAIVLITDGNDNASRLNTFKAVQLARRVSVPIYTVGFASLVGNVLPKGATEQSLLVLKRFSAETGGALFQVRDPDELKEAVLKIQREMRYQYVIGYYPSRKVWDGTYRKVKVDSSKKRISIRARSGYYADP